MSIHICTLQLDKRRQQITDAGTHMFPINAYYNDFQAMHEQKVPWHWHLEVELIYVASGSVNILIQDDVITLQEQDGIFINANTLHSLTQVSQNAIAYSFVFATSLISGAAGSIFEQYTQPLLHCAKLPFVLFNHHIAPQKEVANAILLAFKAYEEGAFGYEWIVRDKLSSIWHFMITQVFRKTAHANHQESVELTRMKTMLDFIHSHYQEHILLKDIASCAHISERETIRCFQRIIHDSPVSYVLKYRLSQAANLLQETSLSITEIASLCGFESPSYFAKTFKLHMKQTPRTYRKQEETKKA